MKSIEHEGALDSFTVSKSLTSGVGETDIIVSRPSLDDERVGLSGPLHRPIEV